MNVDVVQRLLAFRPFKRFVLVTVTQHEYEINSPNSLRALGDGETLFWREDGTADFVDLKLIERIRMDDDFGFAELDQMWKPRADHGP